jgi:hypothetical protein
VIFEFRTENEALALENARLKVFLSTDTSFLKEWIL